MPKLLVVNAVDFPGGAELALVRSAQLIADAGWQITMSSPDGKRYEQADTNLAWISQRVGGLGRRQGLAAATDFRNFRRLATTFDTVYFNGTVSARLMASLTGRKTPRKILHVHDMVKRVPKFWGLADAILADSTACAAPIIAGLGHEVTVTGCPVELDPPTCKPPWTKDDRPIVAFIGRFEPRKGALDLVNAAPEIYARCPNARIILVGGDVYGDSTDYSKQIQQSAGRNGIEVWPWQPNVPGLLRHIDVLVVPSRQEPFGTVAAEALAAGVPVVASAVDGLTEVVQDGVTGRLVPPGEPSSLAFGICWALREKQLISDACRESAKRWQTDTFAAKVIKALSASNTGDQSPPSESAQIKTAGHR